MPQPVKIEILMLDRMTPAMRKVYNEVMGLDKGLDKLDSTTSQVTSNMERSFGKMGGIVAGALSVHALKSFGDELINVRGEIQMLESSFQVLLGGKGVSAFMDELRRFAVESPLSLTAVGNAAQMLLAFGVEADKVMTVVRQLGDVSMGDASKFQSLTLAFSQMTSAGKVLSQDLRQMATAGFNPLGEIARTTGKSIQEVTELMDAGKITVEQVAAAFASATSEGGKFVGMTEKQAEGIRGLQAQLEGGVQDALNEIGESQDALITGGYKTAIALVSNYKEIGESIMELVAVYGTYRAALAVSIALRKTQVTWLRQAVLEKRLAMAANTALTNSEAKQIATTKLLTLAKRNLVASLKAVTTAMMANPYALAAAGIAALSYGIYKLITYQTDAEKAQNRLNDSFKEGQRASLSEQMELAKLKGELSALTKGTDEYNTVKEKIVKGYGKYYDGLADEIEKVGLTEAAYNKLTEAITRSFGARQYEKFMQEQTGELEETMSKNLGKIQDRLIDKLGEEAGTRYYTKIRQAIVGGELGISGTNFYDISGLDEETRKALDQVSGRGSSILPNYDAEKYIRNIIKAQQLTDDLDKKAKVKFGIGDIAPDAADGNEEIIESFDDVLDKVEQTTKKITELKKELQDLRNGDKQVGEGQLKKTLEDKTKELKEAEDLLALLTGKDKKTVKSEETAAAKQKKEAQQMADLEQKIANEEIKAALEAQSRALENEQALLDIEEDGWEKRYKQAELNHKKNKLAIEKRVQELIEKQQEAERNTWKLGGEKGIFTPSSVTEADLFANSPEAKKEIETSRETESQVSKAATEALHKELLAKYQDYTTRRLKVEEKYQKDVKALSLLPDSAEKDAAIAEAEKQRKESIKAINDEEASELKKTSDLFVRLFADASEKSVSEIRRVIEETQALYDLLSKKNTDGSAYEITEKDAKEVGFTVSQLNAFKGDAEQMKAIMDGLIAKKKELAGKSEFEAFSMSIDKALKKINAGGTKNIGEGIADIGSAVKNIMPKVEEFGQSLGSIFGEQTADDIGTVIELIGATAEVGMGVGKIMSGDVVGGITDVISGLSKVFTMASDAEARHQAALEEIAERRLAMQRAYNLLLLEQNLLLKEATTVFGEQEITKAINAVKNYAQTIGELKKEMRGDAPEKNEFAYMVSKSYREYYQKQLDQYNEGLKGLYDQEIVTGRKKTGLFGWGKGKDTYSSIMEVYDDIIDKEGNLNKARIQAILDTEKMDDATRAYLENLIALQDHAEAAAETLRDYLQETFGVLGEDIMSSITSAIRDEGIDAWEEFGKSGAKVLEKLGEQLAYELFFASKFKNLQKELEAIYDTTDDPEEIARKQMELLGDFYAGIGDEMAGAQAFLEEWKKKAAEQGFDLYTDDSATQSGKAGAFTTITQDQGTKLEGLFTSVQNHVSSMDDKMTDLSRAMYDSMDVLQRIETNTADAVTELRIIKEDIKAMIRDGVIAR